MPKTRKQLNDARYYAENHDKVRAQALGYAKAHREEERARSRAYDHAHRDDPVHRAKATERMRQWRAANVRRPSGRRNLRGPIENYYGEATYLTCPNCGVDEELIDLDTREYGPRGGLKGFLPLRCPACSTEVARDNVWTKAPYKYDADRDRERRKRWAAANPEKHEAAWRRSNERRSRLTLKALYG